MPEGNISVVFAAARRYYYKYTGTVKAFFVIFMLMMVRRYHKRPSIIYTQESDVGAYYIDSDAEPLKIPRIIHQIWSTEDIPRKFAKFIQSWEHEGSEYWFWTDVMVKEFIMLKYPALYDRFMCEERGTIQFAEAAKFFILHYFGGFQIDLNMEKKNPLEPLAFRHNCVVASVPLSSAVRIHGRLRFASKAFMGCRPGHPLLGLLIENLSNPAASIEHKKNTSLEGTNPLILDDTINKYESQYTSYFNLGDHDLKNTVFMAPSDYFIPIFGIEGTMQLRRFCNDERHIDLCGQLQSKDFSVSYPISPYSEHHFGVTLSYEDDKETIPIGVIIPGVKIVDKTMYIKPGWR